MSHSLTRVWIHGVFGTNNHEPAIHRGVECQLHAHLKEHLEDDLNCEVRIINGTENHIHLLFLLSPAMAVRDVFKNIKGESSHWWNQNRLSERPFAWQVGYGAFSVSESMAPRVEEYIANQKEHHRERTFAQEVQSIIRKYATAEINH